MFKVTARDQGHYKGPSGAFVTYCNISCLFCNRAEKYNYSLADYIQKDGQLRFVHKYMNSNILHEEILSYLFSISLYP